MQHYRQLFPTGQVGLFPEKNMSVFANQPTVHSGEVGSQAIDYLTECHPTFFPSDIGPPRHVVSKTFGHSYQNGLAPDIGVV